ncbi:hypothetical protein ACFE04_002786 [Oxalis oulophora]
MEESQLEDQSKPRVVKVESVESWDLYLTQATNQGSPVVVHFTASWCMPSVAMNPFFEELAATYTDTLFLTVDVDELKSSAIFYSNKKLRRLLAPLPVDDEEVAAKLDVKAMPTFLLMKDGAAVDKLVGANPDEMKKRVDVFVQSARATSAIEHNLSKLRVLIYNDSWWLGFTVTLISCILLVGEAFRDKSMNPCFKIKKNKVQDHDPLTPQLIEFG